MISMCHRSSLHKRLQDYNCADSIHQRFIPAVFLLQPGIPYCFNSHDGCKPLIHSFNGDILKF